MNNESLFRRTESEEHVEEGIYDYEICVAIVAAMRTKPEYIWRRKRMKQGGMKEGAQSFYHHKHDDD